MPWSPLAVLPNLRLADPIEASPLALVPLEDERVAALRAQHPRFGDFVTRFTTEHGSVVHPAVLLKEFEGENQQYSTEAMVAFRNSIAVATALRSHSVYLRYGTQHRIMYSDAFEFYPWMLDRNNERLISLTPAQMALHTVNEFHGQSAAGVPLQGLARHELDRPLLAALLEVWKAAYRKSRQSAKERALFRSLNMANAALAMPAAKAALIFDYGRQCALWISAFEILAHHHSGKDRANFGFVRDLLEARPFIDRRIRPRRYRISYGGKRENVALPTKLYKLLYDVRNDFLHGNAVTRSSLLLPWSGRFLGEFAPLLYRCALRNFLGFGPAPREINAAAAAGDREPHVQFDVEEALQCAREPPEQEA
jgi:hypothetical protein